MIALHEKPVLRRLLLCLLGALLSGAALHAHVLPVQAEKNTGASAPEIALTSLSTPDGNWTASLTDGDYGTAVGFEADDILSISASAPVSSLYIEWSRVPPAWTLEADGQTLSCGTNGFLHEFITLPAPASAFSMHMPSGGRIANIRAFSDGALPADVQVWDPPCEKADFLVFSTHTDDEILFLGGVLATYGAGRGCDVQLAYMIDFSGTDLPVREHEKLDGLWTIGIRHYPVNAAILNDSYSTSLDAARASYSYDVVCAFTTEAIRRFQPQVVVTQDFNGEYGHGAHMLLAHAVKDGVEGASDASVYPDSAAAYGVFNVPKAYFHLYDHNPIRLDLRQPIASLGGQTAVEAAAEAYKQHVSQQWMDFYVSDDSNDTNKYAPKCADFGLYRSLVGEDTGNDMMEHLVSYAESARLEEEARLQEEERKRQEEEQAKAALTYTDKTKTGTGEVQKDADKDRTEEISPLRVALIAVAILAPVVALLSGVALWRNNKTARRRRARAAKKRNTARQRSTRRPRRRGY